MGEIHISRPIGNFDTTASRIGWQVARERKSHSKGTKTTTMRQGLSYLQTHKTPLPIEWRFAFPCWSLASQQMLAGGACHRACRRIPSRSPLFRAAQLADALAGLCWFVGWPDSSSSRYITGTL